MLGPDIIVPQRPRFLGGKFQRLLGTRRKRNISQHLRLRTRLNHFFDFDADGLQINAQFLQNGRRDAFSFAHQPQQEMFRADIIMVETPRFFFGVYDHFPRSFRKSIEHDTILLIFHV